MEYRDGLSVIELENHRLHAELKMMSLSLERHVSALAKLQDGYAMSRVEYDKLERAYKLVRSELDMLLGGVFWRKTALLRNIRILMRKISAALKG